MAKTACWFDLVRVELDAMTEGDLIEPDGEVQNNEREVGEMNFEMRKLWTRAEQASAEKLRFIAEAQCAKTPAARERAIAKACEMQAKSVGFREIMWICIRDEFGLWGASGGSIGVRTGWKVVRFTDDKPQSPLDLLRQLLS